MEAQYSMSTSESYGGYGGVVRCTKYVPPAAHNFIPQPALRPVTGRYIPPTVPGFIPQPAIVPFTMEDRENLQLLVDINGPVMNVNNILFRTRTDDLTGITDRTFAMTTSSNPFHTLTYTMPASSTAINMLNTDGGYF